MALVERVVFDILSEVLYVGILKVFVLGNGEHFATVGCGEELALLVEQLQRVPLTRIVTGGDDDAAVGTTHAHGQLCGRCGGVAYVEHIIAHAHQCAAHHLTHHGTRDAPVAAYDNLV